MDAKLWVAITNDQIFWHFEGILTALTMHISDLFYVNYNKHALVNMSWKYQASTFSITEITGI